MLARWRRFRFRLFVALGLVMVLAAGALVWVSLASDDSRGQAYCWGSLGSKDLGVMNPYNGGKYRARDDSTPLSVKGGKLREYPSCDVYWEGNGNTSYHLASVQVRPSDLGWPWGKDAVRNTRAQFGVVSPAGPGLPAWTSVDQTEDKIPAHAELRLPGACRKVFHTGKYGVRLSLTLRARQDRVWDDATTRRQMAKVVTRIAAHLTKEHHCGDGTSYKYDLDAHVSASFEKMPPGKACGLSGFSPLTSFEKDAVWQRVAGELDDTWSCVAVRSDGNPLGGPSEEDSLNEGTTLSAFTVTSNRRYLEGFKKSHGRTYADEEEGTRSKVMRCGGEEYLLQVMYPGSESDQDAIRKYSEKHQAGPDSLVKRFEGSVRRALKCEK